MKGRCGCAPPTAATTRTGSSSSPTGSTYLLPDIRVPPRQVRPGADLLVDVWGADHHGHVSRVEAAIAELGHDPDELEVLLTQLVNLVRAGKPVRLSKRAGDIIELADVLGEVGADAARLTYLLQSVDSAQTFDLEVVSSQAMENPVYYVQPRTPASSPSDGWRPCGSRAAAVRPGGPRSAHPRAGAGCPALSPSSPTWCSAPASRGPHQVTTWVRELAGAFHGFYDCYVMGEGIEPDLTQARLWLVEAARIGLAVGLDLLGVSAPESM